MNDKTSEWVQMRFIGESLEIHSGSSKCLFEHLSPILLGLAGYFKAPYVIPMGHQGRRREFGTGERFHFLQKESLYAQLALLYFFKQNQ